MAPAAPEHPRQILHKDLTAIFAEFEKGVQD